MNRFFLYLLVLLLLMWYKKKDESMLLSKMSDAVREMTVAIKETVHGEAHPELYSAVMDLPGFSEESLMAVLTYLAGHKAMSLVFLQMSEARRVLWVTSFLKSNSSH